MREDRSFISQIDRAIFLKVHVERELFWVKAPTQKRDQRE
jgi:hypothetical protein